MNDKQVDKIIKKCGKIIFLAILLAWAMFNWQAVDSIWSFIMKVLTPFLTGIFIALFLNIPMSFFEKKLENRKKSTKPKKKQGVALVLAIISIIAVVLFVLILIIPELIRTAVIVANNAPLYQETAENIVKKIEDIYPDLNMEAVNEVIMSNIENIKNMLKEQIPSMLSSSLTVLVGTINGLVNFFIGIGFACILLSQKDNVKIGFKRLIYTYLQEEIAHKLNKFLTAFVDNFNKFVVAQGLSALILGGVCLVGCLVFQVPYAIQIAVLVGFASLVPIFGSITGIIIGLIMIIVVSPVKALIFLIFSVIAWQICENFVKPHIIGKKTGISDLWLFIATIGGGMAFGVLGLILSVPTVNAFYTIEAERLDKTNIEEEVK